MSPRYGSAVYFEAPPEHWFVEEVHVAVDCIYAEVPREDWAELTKALMRLMEYLSLAPRDAGKRAIRKGNVNFVRMAKNYGSVHRFLVALGYKDYGTHFLLPTLYRSRIQEAHRLIAKVAGITHSAPTKRWFFF